MSFCVTNSQKRYVSARALIAEPANVYNRGMAPPSQITYSRRSTWSCAQNAKKRGERIWAPAARENGSLLPTTESPHEDNQVKTSRPLKNSLGTEEAASSSTERSSPAPTHRALLSSVEPPSDSELSSLPATPPTRPSSPAMVARKPTASFLKNDVRKKRKRDEIDEDPGDETNAGFSSEPKVPSKKPNNTMTQMKIDLGGEIKKTCRNCEMEYIPSILEDSEIHKRFCKSNQIGVEMGKAFLKDDTVRRVRSDITAGTENEFIVVVNRGCSLAARNKAKAVLHVVNQELGAADLEDDILWAEHKSDAAVSNPQEADNSTAKSQRKGKSKSVTAPERKHDHFKTFLHLVGDRCVAFCMAEKIIRAYPVVPENAQIDDDGFNVPVVKSSSVSYSTKSDLALLGIYRIWTSKSYRSKGLAVNLLETARTNFFYGVQATKDLVAFSQPTASGKELAERYFGTEVGWKVYS